MTDKSGKSNPPVQNLYESVRGAMRQLAVPIEMLSVKGEEPWPQAKEMLAGGFRPGEFITFLAPAPQRYASTMMLHAHMRGGVVLWLTLEQEEDAVLVQRFKAAQHTVPTREELQSVPFSHREHLQRFGITPEAYAKAVAETVKDPLLEKVTVDAHDPQAKTYDLDF